MCPRAVALGSVLVGLLVVLSGCGDMKTITAEQAAERVELHLRAVETAIPGARFEVHRESHISPCNEPEDGGPLGRVYASAGYWIRDVPAERNAEVYEIALGFWEIQGFRVVVDKRRPGRAFVEVEAPEPDFTTVSLVMSGDATHTLSIVSSSPCVWPDGVPAPQPRRW